MNPIETFSLRFIENEPKKTYKPYKLPFLTEFVASLLLFMTFFLPESKHFLKFQWFVSKNVRIPSYHACNNAAVFLFTD